MSESVVAVDEQATWTAGSAWAARAVSWSVAACVVAGALALVLVVTGFGSVPPSVRAEIDTAVQASDRQVVSAFGQRVVRTWLAAGRDDEAAVEALIDVDNVQLPRINRNRLGVSHVVDVVGPTDEVWSVTVGVDVVRDQVSAHRYFAVPVQLEESGAVTALTLPAPVPAPIQISRPARLAYPQLTAPQIVETTVAQFLAAYWTAEGDVARYTTPTSTIRPITPAIYTTVTIGSVQASIIVETEPGDGQTVAVLVTANAVLGVDETVTTQIGLDLISREGRWEIDTIDLIPPVERRTATATPKPTPIETTNGETK